MAKKGDIARETAKNLIIAAFGDGFVGIQDKKIYVNVSDGAETVQLAIAMTMPKTPIAGGGVTVGEANASVPMNAVTPTELSGEDQEKINQLKVFLGVE